MNNIIKIELDKLKYEENKKSLDELFQPEGEIIAVKSNELQKFDPLMIRAYLHFNAIYAIITTELIEWIKNNIDLSYAIEIGSGVGTLGKALGIRCTDSYLQERPDIQMTYLLTGQPIIKYGKHVEKIEAIDAIKKYKPKIVIASWLTHKWNDQKQNGNYWSPDEMEIIKNVNEYYLVGNIDIHSFANPAISKVTF